jgi:hypothetical protein
MTCEVPWLRLTDGHAWRTPSRPREETVTPVRPDDLSPLLSVQQIASLYHIPLVLALKWHSACGTRLDRVKWVYDQVQEHGQEAIAAKMQVRPQTIIKMIAEYKRLTGQKVDVNEKHQKIYTEYMAGVKTRELATKYVMHIQSIRNIVADYAKKNNLPLLKKRLLTQVKS